MLELLPALVIRKISKCLSNKDYYKFIQASKYCQQENAGDIELRKCQRTLSKACGRGQIIAARTLLQKLARRNKMSINEIILTRWENTIVAAIKYNQFTIFKYLLSCLSAPIDTNKIGNTLNSISTSSNVINFCNYIYQSLDNLEQTSLIRPLLLSKNSEIYDYLYALGFRGEHVVKYNLLQIIKTWPTVNTFNFLCKCCEPSQISTQMLLQIINSSLEIDSVDVTAAVYNYARECRRLDETYFIIGPNEYSTLIEYWSIYSNEDMLSLIESYHGNIDDSAHLLNFDILFNNFILYNIEILELILRRMPDLCHYLLDNKSTLQAVWQQKGRGLFLSLEKLCMCYIEKYLHQLSAKNILPLLIYSIKFHSPNVDTLLSILHSGYKCNEYDTLITNTCMQANHELWKLLYNDRIAISNRTLTIVISAGYNDILTAIYVPGRQNNYSLIGLARDNLQTIHILRPVMTISQSIEYLASYDSPELYDLLKGYGLISARILHQNSNYGIRTLFTNNRIQLIEYLLSSNEINKHDLENNHKNIIRAIINNNEPAVLVCILKYGFRKKYIQKSRDMICSKLGQMGQQYFLKYLLDERLMALRPIHKYKLLKSAVIQNNIAFIYFLFEEKILNDADIYARRHQLFSLIIKENNYDMVKILFDRGLIAIDDVLGHVHFARAQLMIKDLKILVHMGLRSSDNVANQCSMIPPAVYNDIIDAL